MKTCCKNACLRTIERLFWGPLGYSLGMLIAWSIGLGMLYQEMEISRAPK